MPRVAILCVVLVFLLPASCDAQAAVPHQGDMPTYGLRVAVDEVVVTFHAADAQGLSVNDLKVNELHLLDNGKPPAKVIDFRLLSYLPLRAGILVDTSDSMQEQRLRNRAIGAQYIQQILRRNSDEAFVMDFGRTSKELQPLTSDPEALAAALLKTSPPGPSGIHGTAVFDAIFRACLYGFGKADDTAHGNFILLLSDGEDNASNVSLADAVAMCQRTNTVIYAFQPAAQLAQSSTGPATLRQLAAETGGHMFSGHDSAEEVMADLRSIEANLRNQYWLAYRPVSLRRDGSFHHIELQTPERVDTVTIRSGYYAPAH